MRTRADVLERGLLIGGQSILASSGKLAADAAQAAFPEGRNGTLIRPVVLTDVRPDMDVVSRVRSGIIHINDEGIGDEPMAPFGGVKNSGYGKFGGTAGFESFTEQRWVTIQHSGRSTYPF